MGFPQPTGTVFSSQVVASRGGFFTAYCLQFPPPPDGPEVPVETFAALLLVLLLFSALVLMFLPEKWSRKVIEIAFCIGGKK